MNLTEIFLKSPEKLESFLNNISIPIHTWQIRRKKMFLIDYNSAAYEETNGEIKNYLGSRATEYYRENIDLLNVLKECVDKSSSISKEIKYFCSSSNELKQISIKTDFIPPDLVLVQMINKAMQEVLEKKLIESEEKYNLITENAYDLIGVINRKFKFEYVNKNSLFKILGYTTKEVIGKNVLKFIHPEDVELALKKYSEGFNAGESISEMRARHKQGHYVWLGLNGKLYTDHNGEQKVVLISRDITHHKLLEQKLEESEEKYRVAYDQAEFFKNLCVHDISNILLVINGSYQFCSLLLDDPEKIEEVKLNLEKIKDQIKRANLLIKNIQTLSKLDRNRPLLKLVDICASLTDSIKYIKESYKEKNVDINMNSSNEQFIVSANNLIFEAFENIMINAINYNNKPNIKISIKISKIEKNNNNYVKIEFGDNGIGISDSRKEFIFQEGHKREKYTKGMGFGLILIKRIIDSYNGQIWVEDRVPNDYTQGCNFIILIPMR